MGSHRGNIFLTLPRYPYERHRLPAGGVHNGEATTTPREGDRPCFGPTIEKRTLTRVALPRRTRRSNARRPAHAEPFRRHRRALQRRWRQRARLLQSPKSEREDWREARRRGSCIVAVAAPLAGAATPPEDRKQPRSDKPLEVPYRGAEVRVGVDGFAPACSALRTARVSSFQRVARSSASRACRTSSSMSCCAWAAR